MLLGGGRGVVGREIYDHVPRERVAAHVADESSAWHGLRALEGVAFVLVEMEIEFGAQKGTVNAAALVTRGMSADEDDWSQDRSAYGCV